MEEDSVYPTYKEWTHGNSLMLDPVDFVGLYRQNIERQAAAAQARPS